MDDTDIRIIELTLNLSIILFVFLSIWAPKLSKKIILVLLFVNCYFLSLRSITYNSDTFNYFRYYESTPLLGLIESFYSKIEPFHYLLINLSPNFSIWLGLELIIIFALFYFATKKSSMVFFIVNLGFILPLLSSSFRYVLGLLLVVFLYQRFHSSKYGHLSSTLASLAHTSMLPGVYVIKAPFFIISIIPLLVYLINYFAINYAERFDSDTVFGNDLVGLRALALYFIISLYAIHKIGFNDLRVVEFNKFSLVIILLFLSANFIFPMSNRWMYLVIIIFMFDLDFKYCKLFSGIQPRFYFSLIYLFMLFPFLFYSINVIYFDAPVG